MKYLQRHGKNWHGLTSLSFYFCFAVMALLQLTGCDYQFRTPLFEAGRKDNFGPTGLTYNGRDFIMVGSGNMIYTVTDIALDPYEGEELGAPSGGYRTASDPINPDRRSIEICGLAWEGDCCGAGYLWAADATNLELIKLNDRGNLLKSLPSPTDNPSGIAFDGKNLWVSDEVESKIYNVSIDDGHVIRFIDSPIKHPTDLSWGNKRLWVVGASDYKKEAGTYHTGVRAIDIETGNFFGIDDIKYITRPTAMTWADNHLWIGDYNVNRIFMIDPPKETTESKEKSESTKEDK